MAARELEHAETRAFHRYGLDVRTRFVRLREPPLRVRVLEAGSGEPLLLLGGPSASAWVPLMAELTGVRLLAVDRPGCGLSDPFDYRGTDLRKHAVDFLSSLLDALGLPRVMLAGNSMGGLWGFWLALDRPDRITALGQLGCPALLLDTSAPFSTRVLSVPALRRISPSSPKGRVLDRLAGLRAETGAADEVRDCLRLADQVWARSSTRLSLIEQALHLRGSHRGFRLTEPQLARVKHPVLFLWGDRDHYGRPEAGRRACAALPDGELQILSAGHLPWLDQPAACGAALGSFLRRVAEASRAAGPTTAAVRSSPAPPAPTPGAELRWLGEVLWPASSRARITSGPDPVPGFRRAEAYAVFPSVSRPLLLTPLSTRGAASASLLRYNSLRPAPRRLARASIGLGMGLGLIQPLIRSRLSVWVDGGAELLEDHLGEVFGVEAVTTSITLGRPGPFRKPLLLAMSPSGEVLGFVKVGWDDITRTLVRTEVRALGLLADDPLSSLGAPRLVEAGPWGELELCITAPLPLGMRRYPQSDTVGTIPAVRQLAALVTRTEAGLSESSYWGRLRRRLSEVGTTSAHRSAPILGRFADRLESAHGSMPLGFGFWHGDWVPWNIGRSGGRLFAWDWEHSADDVPFGFDPIHYRFQLAFISRGRTFSEAAAETRGPVVEVLEGLGITRHAAAVVFWLYLLEGYLRYLEPLLAGFGREPRFDPHAALHLFEGALSGEGVPV